MNSADFDDAMVLEIAMLSVSSHGSAAAVRRALGNHMRAAGVEAPLWRPLTARDLPLLVPHRRERRDPPTTRSHPTATVLRQHRRNGALPGHIDSARTDGDFIEADDRGTSLGDRTDLVGSGEALVSESGHDLFTIGHGLGASN